MKTLPLILFLFVGITLHAQYDSNGMIITTDDLPIYDEAPYYEDTQTELQDCIWEDIRPLDEINTNEADAYPWISPNGLRLYFTQRLPIVGIDDLTSCWLTNDELEMFFTIYISGQTTLLYTQRNHMDSLFSEPVLVELDGVNLGFFSAPSLTQDKSQLFLFSSYDQTKKIQVFDRIAVNNYIFSHSVDFGGAHGPGQLTKNDLGYYMTWEYLASRDLYSSYRNSTDTTFSSFMALEGVVNTSSFREFQPTLSQDEEIMVFVRSEQPFWAENDLYLSRSKCITTDIEHTYPYEYGITIYPVPASAELSISIENGNIRQINVYDVLGKHILSQTPKHAYNQVNINTQTLVTGVYFCQINLKSGDSITRKIVIE